MPDDKLIFATRPSMMRLSSWVKTLFTLGGWWMGSKYELTKSHVRIRRGVFSKYQRDIPIARIQDVTYSAGLLGRIFGYGTLRIESASGQSGAETMYKISRAKQMRELILQQTSVAPAPQSV